jgi:hypothetical protein
VPRVANFRGLFARGENEICPPEYAVDCLNVEFDEQGAGTRAGVDSSIQATGNWNGVVKRVYEYRKKGEASRLLILDDTGKIWDSSTAMTTPVLSITAMTDFSAVTIFERCYISPHNGDTGLANEKVYVYDGTGTARAAAGDPPSSYTLGVVDSSEDGNVEEGMHLFSVAFETVSGHITKFSTEEGLFVEYSAPGGKKVDISGIPVGPSYVTARHIICTKVLKDYDGNPNDKQWFFVDGGKIDNNVDTTLTGLSFFDSDLISSAASLQNQLATIPAGSCIGSFGARMVVGGEEQNSATVRVSDPGDPESMSDLEGYVNVYPGDAGGAVHSVVEFHKTLYIMKDYRTYATEDNGSAPNTWDPIEIDSAQGCGVHGSAGVLDEKGQTLGMFLVATRTGLQVVKGVYGDEPELTYPIAFYWKRINQQHFDQVQLALDPVAKRIYLTIPLDSATEPNILLTADYTDGLDAKNIKWCPWSFQKKCTSIWIETNYLTKEVNFKFGASDGGIYVRNSATLNDNGTAINSYYRTGYMEDQRGWAEQTYNGVRARARGAGNLDIALYSPDDVYTQTLPSVVLSIFPGKEVFRKATFTAEKVSVKLATSSANEWWHVTSITVLSELLWQEYLQS